jgi:hypothetical protein
VPNRLAQHGCQHTLRGPLDELEGKRAADAVSHEEELPDAEVVHQPELVVGEGAPRVIDRDRTGGLAAIRIALVHRDAAEIVLEGLRGVEHGSRPIADLGVQATAGVTSRGKPEPTSR